MILKQVENLGVRDGVELSSDIIRFRNCDRCRSGACVGVDRESSRFVGIGLEVGLEKQRAKSVISKQYYKNKTK